ncbi:MAG: [LysW]-aminoadipate kinase [Chloroflexi bacterium]|nr:MAG: [LysW]-aminoadipate kinase [Chloroflexota bacterium]
MRDRQSHEGRRRERRAGDERLVRFRGGRRPRLPRIAPVTLRAVIKAGGSAGVDRDAVADLVADVARSDEIVLVHGASAETNKLAEALGHAQETITSPSGHSSRRTDRRTLEIFAMAALGVENFLYVEKLQQRGIDAIGLSGLSGRLLVARKKDVRAVRGEKTVLLRDDYTGKVEAVNLPLLTQFIGPGRVPVVAPLALSTEQQALNVDGDRVAAAIAVAIDADALIILTSVPGLLRDVDDAGSIVAEATLAEAEALANGRMKVKILAAREALEGGVDEVVIRSASGDTNVRTVIRS